MPANEHLDAVLSHEPEGLHDFWSDLAAIDQPCDGSVVEPEDVSLYQDSAKFGRLMSPHRVEERTIGSRSELTTVARGTSTRETRGTVKMWIDGNDEGLGE